MNKYTITFLILLIVVILSWIIFKPKPSSTGVLNKDAVVVAFGDSLVAGVGAGEEENFVARLSQQVSIPIINKGVSGETTAGGLRRLEGDVLNEQPDVVIVLLGGNDALRNVPETETFSNLETIVTRIQATGAKVLLLGIRGGLLGDSYKGRFEDLAKKKNVEYVSDVLSGLFADNRYMSDSIHPNAAGYQKIADRVEPVLRKMLEVSK